MIYKYLLSFYLLMPITFVSGPLIPELLLLLSIGLFMYAILSKKLIIKNSIYIILSIIVCSFILISFTFNYSEQSITGSFLFYFRFPIMALILFYILKEKGHYIRYFYLSIGFILLIVSIDAIIQFYLKLNLLGMRVEVGNRISGVFGNEYILGKYLFFTYCVFYYLHFKNTSFFKFQNFVFLMISALVSFSIFISGERTSICLFILFSTLSILYLDYLSFKIKLLILFIFPLIFLFLIIFYPNYFERFIPIFDWSINPLKFPYAFLQSSSQSFYYNLMYYYDFIIISIKTFLQDPMLGIGPKMYRVECLKYIDEYKFACSTHPHNTYLQLLSETGLFLALFTISLWIKVFLILIKQKINNFRDRSNRFQYPYIILLISYFVFLFPFLPSNSIFNNTSSLLLYFPLGFLLYEIFQNQKLNLKIRNLNIIE